MQEIAVSMQMKDRSSASEPDQINKAKTRRVSESQCGVEEHRALGRSRIVRDGGRRTRENAGMSSENKVRIFIVENLRFPGEGSSSQGKSGPKPRANAVGDGQLVEIPVPPSNR